MNFTPKRLFHVPPDRPTEGTFPAGLLPRVLEFIQAQGHTHEFLDYRDIARLKPTPDFTKVGTLREGQDKALIQIAYADCGIIVAATAFGKSFIITQACRMYPKLRFLVVSPRVAVINSLRDRLQEALGEDQVGQAGGGKSILGCRVMVSTTKSMHKIDPSEVDILFFDEVHGVGDNEVATRLGYYSECRRFGFTASPVRGDKTEMCMEALFGRFLVEVSYQEAVEMGNVVPIDVWMVHVGGTIREGRDSVTNKRLSYWQNDTRNRIVAAVAQRVPDDQQCLIFVETLEHAVHLSKHLPNYTLVHFGSVRSPFLAHEWLQLTPEQLARSKGWIQTGEYSFRRATPEDVATPHFGWVATKKTAKEFRDASEAAGHEIRMLGRLKEYKCIHDVDMENLKPGDYYLVKHEEYILDVPKSDLKLTAKEKDDIRKKFESGELKKVIATSTWKEGVDFEQLANLIRADGATSEVMNTQMSGRLSRLYDGKISGKMIDFRDEFNDWARRRTNDRLAIYRGHGWTIHN